MAQSAPPPSGARAPKAVRPDGSSREELWVAHLGRIPYREGLALQQRLRSARGAGAVPDSLLLLEHPPVYTKGRRTTPADLPLGDAWYLERGIDVADTDRGGRVTYHGPGQLVGYPIMRIDDVLAYVRTMEAALVAALADEGISAEVRKGLTGVWAGDRKIGSIGLHVSRGVTTHGFAVNVDNDLTPFEWIVPCGIDQVRMTSVAEESAAAVEESASVAEESASAVEESATAVEESASAVDESGRAGAMPCFRKRVAWRFAEAFGRRQRLVSLPRLLAAAECGAEAAPSPLHERAEAAPSPPRQPAEAAPSPPHQPVTA